VLHVPDFDAAIPSAESGPTPDTGLAGVRALADMLAGVPDPRKVRGIRHQIGVVLTVMVCEVLAGARDFRETADRAAELPPALLGVIGCRRHPVTGALSGAQRGDDAPGGARHRRGCRR
jgi:hypothetical protein